VSGARLSIQNRKIYLLVKYSLLSYTVWVQNFLKALYCFYWL
jgi:hypothetical protein